MDSEELAHASGKVVCVAQSNTSTDLVPKGTASLWHTAAGEYLITCGEAWVMPLCGQPVLRVNRGVYVFPCPPGSDTKNYVLLLRTEEVGDEEGIAVFEATLASTTQVRDSSSRGPAAGGASGGAAASGSGAAPPAAEGAGAGALAAAGAGGALSVASLRAQLPAANPANVGATLSRGIVGLGNGVKSALVAGATFTGYGVAAASKAIGRAVGPAAAPLQLSQTTLTRMHQAKMVTKSAAVLTGAMVEGAAVMARSIGAAAAAAIAETETGKAMLAQGATPTGAAVKQGMEEAAVIVGKASAGATRDFMHTRYGASGDAPTEAALALAGDVGQVALHARNLGVGGMVRKAVCETAAQTLALGDGRPGAAPAAAAGGMGAAAGGLALGGGAGLGLAMAAASTPGVMGLARSNPGLANAAMQHAMANPELAMQAVQFVAANPAAAQAALQVAGSLAAAGAQQRR